MGKVEQVYDWMGGCKGKLSKYFHGTNTKIKCYSFLCKIKYFYYAFYNIKAMTWHSTIKLFLFY